MSTWFGWTEVSDGRSRAHKSQLKRKGGHIGKPPGCLRENWSYKELQSDTGKISRALTSPLYLCLIPGGHSVFELSFSYSPETMGQKSAQCRKNFSLSELFRHTRAALADSDDPALETWKQ